MEKNNQKQINRSFSIFLFSTLLMFLVNDKIFLSQNTDPQTASNFFQNCKITSLFDYDISKNRGTFIALFKDSLIDIAQKSDTEIVHDIIYDMEENEIKMMIEKDSIRKLITNHDVFWTFDTILSGRRIYGTVYSESSKGLILGNHYSDNWIYLYSSEDIRTSSAFLGIMIYNPKNEGWKFQLYEK